MKEKLPNDLENLENDEIGTLASGSNEEANVISKYGKLIIIASVVIVAIIGGIYYFSYTSEKNQEAAATALSRIKMYFDQEMYSKALAGGDSVPQVRGEKVLGLKEIADEYGSTPSGKFAALLAGESYLQLNQFADAKKYFEIASGADSEILEKGGYAGLGVCFEKENNYQEAVKNYEKAFAKATDASSKGRYMLYAAMCYAKLGDKEKAIALFTDIVKDKELGEFANPAKAELVRLGTIIE